MSQATILVHLTSRIKADIAFLLHQGLISRYDADQVLAKLPTLGDPTPEQTQSPSMREQDNEQSVVVNPQLASPPSSVASTPRSERAPVLAATTTPSVKKSSQAATPTSPSPPPKAQIPQVRALWSYNEDGSVSVIVTSFPTICLIITLFVI